METTIVYRDSGVIIECYTDDKEHLYDLHPKNVAFFFPDSSDPESEILSMDDVIQRIMEWTE